jgi:hypothetical protein
LNQSKLTVPKLNTRDDAVAAQNLVCLSSEAELDLRKVIALGLAAWEIKEQRLGHGQWGRWLATHAPVFSQPDAITGRPKAASQLLSHMELAKNVLALAGFPSIESWLKEVAKFPKSGICSEGKFLLLPESEVPAGALPLRQKICALVEGKTRRQLSCRSRLMKQSTQADTEEVRLDSKPPAIPSWWHSDSATAMNEELDLSQFANKLVTYSDWVLRIVNVADLAMTPDDVIKKFCEATEAAAALARRVLETRQAICPGDDK